MRADPTVTVTPSRACPSAAVSGARSDAAPRSRPARHAGRRHRTAPLRGPRFRDRVDRRAKAARDKAAWPNCVTTVSVSWSRTSMSSIQNCYPLDCKAQFNRRGGPCRRTPATGRTSLRTSATSGVSRASLADADIAAMMTIAAGTDRKAAVWNLGMGCPEKSEGLGPTIPKPCARV